MPSGAQCDPYPQMVIFNREFVSDGMLPGDKRRDDEDEAIDCEESPMFIFHIYQETVAKRAYGTAAFCGSLAPGAKKFEQDNASTKYEVLREAQKFGSLSALVTQRHRTISA